MGAWQLPSEVTSLSRAYYHFPKGHCRRARTAGQRQVFYVAQERQRGAAQSPSGVHVEERLWREVPPAAARVPRQRRVEPEAACRAAEVLVRPQGSVPRSAAELTELLAGGPTVCGMAGPPARLAGCEASAERPGCLMSCQTRCSQRLPETFRDMTGCLHPARNQGRQQPRIGMKGTE